jgi:hypothetical protein
MASALTFAELRVSRDEWLLILLVRCKSLLARGFADAAHVG